jgi:DNA-binding transcriptional ArsR family regulator
MTTDTISSTFSALADPTRRAILARLALGETSVTELAELDDYLKRIQADQTKPTKQSKTQNLNKEKKHGRRQR